MRYRFVMWATVTAARQAYYANPAATSAYRDATVQEKLEIQEGRVTEKVDQISIAGGTSLAGVQAALQAAWLVFQTEVTNSNPWVRYGSYWDGTTWAAGGAS